MRNRILVILLCVFNFTACDEKMVFDSYKSVPSQWHKDSIISFNFKAPDTLNNYNLFINLRNTSDYKYNNLYLIASLKQPHGKTVIDTLEYKMANEKGEFLGSGFSNVKENKLWYKGYDSPFKFQENGEYQVKLQQAMRENGKVNGVINLEGITDIGFRIETP